MEYNYYKEIKKDLYDAFDEFILYNSIEDEDQESFKKDFYDYCFDSDNVTGNTSGSYYCNAYKAEEALCHNLDLYKEAVGEFGEPQDKNNEYNPEYMDVVIRCYLLSQVLEDTWDSLIKEYKKHKESEKSKE